MASLNPKPVQFKTEQPVLHVVAGVLRNSAGEILLALRPAHKPQGNLWEFPGGKVEAGESALEALKRELYEEVGVEVLAADAWLQRTYQYPDKTVLLDVWQVHEFNGTPHSKEQQTLRWVAPHQLADFTFPPANDVIVAALQADVV